MKIVYLSAIAALALAPLCTDAYAQDSVQSATVQAVVVESGCVAETYVVPGEGAQVSYRLAGPAPVMVSSASCRRLQQADMLQEPLPTDNCTGAQYDFTKQDQLIRETDPVKTDNLVLTPQLTGCYRASKPGIHKIYLPQGGMEGYVLSIRVVVAAPNGSMIGHNYNRLFHSRNLNADPMKKVPICVPLPGQESLCR